jgi:hypothetical protein
MLIEIILFLAISILIAYLVLMIAKKPPSFEGPKPLYDMPITTETEVLPNSYIPLRNEISEGKPYTLRFAIYIESAPKTVSKVDCITTSTPLTSFGPSCTDYTYKTCKCEAINCSNCTMAENTHLTKILGLGNVFELWISGYTSTNDKPYVPAILKIQTAQDKNQYFMESVSLPAIPLQRWNVISIIKEGRRYDVYYGEKLVVSKLLDYTRFASSSDSWKIYRTPGWRGKIGLFRLNFNASTKFDIHADISSILNTRGIPFYLEQLNISDFMFNIKMPECMFGNCNKLPTVKPLNPFAVYETNVQ